MEYNFKNVASVKAKRAVHKVIAVKDNIGDIAYDSGRVVKALAVKTVYASAITLGALFVVVGYYSGDSHKFFTSLTVGTISALVGGKFLKDEFDYIGAVELFDFVKDDIQRTISNVKCVDFDYPMPKKDEREGRSL